MSFNAQFIVQDETFRVRQLSWGVSQQTDVLGQPDARVQGGGIEIELDAQPSAVLHFWAADDTKRFDGEVTVFEDDRATVRDRLEFFDAHCVAFGKHFQNASAAGAMTMRLTLSANKIRFAELEVDNRWPNVER